MEEGINDEKVRIAYNSGYTYHQKTIDKKRKSMQLYSNKFWNNATDNRDKSLISIPVEGFQKIQESLEKSGIRTDSEIFSFSFLG